MRSLHTIMFDLESLEDEYKTRKESLLEEISEIQDKCPHPREFLNTKRIDHVYHSTWGEYSHSNLEVVCSLCDKKRVSADYRKPQLGHILPPPDPKKVIDS